MQTVKVKCKTCQKSFNAPQKEVNRGNGKYCSLSCSAKSRDRLKQPNCTCAQCSKPLYRNPTRIKNSKSGLVFCDRKCKDAAQRIGGISEIMPNHYGNGSSRYREVAFNHYEHRCNRCGYEKPEILQVHHKDRDRTNNDISNLEILCPNCHAWEHIK